MRFIQGVLLFFAFCSPLEASQRGLSIVTQANDDSLAAGSVVLKWRGPIEPPMARDLRDAIEKHADKTKIIVDISSEGGFIEEADAVVRVLEPLRASKQLVTWVERGGLCASACVPIFLVADVRIAAEVSSWMFHGVRPLWSAMPNSLQTQLALEKYFVPRGVSAAFIDEIMPMLLKPGELWLTGSDLMERNSKIITKALPRHRELQPKLAPFDPQIRPR